MQQVVLHQFPDAWVKYRFKCRNDVDLVKYKDEIEKELDHLCTLRFDADELSYLSKIRFLKPDFIQFLRLFQLNRDYIKVSVINWKLDITVEGPWLYTIFFEIFVLAIVQEVYFRHQNIDTEDRSARLDIKIQKLKEYADRKGVMPTIIDFGARRRCGRQWHEVVVSTLAFKNIIIGTSDVKLAMQYNLKPIGTFAHEFVMAFQGLGVCQLKDSQKYAFESWVKEYRGDLGIALSDTLGTDKFLADFDLYFSKLYDGLRHDSGDPWEWGDTMIKHYEKFGIDPRTKSLVFSDGLDIPTVIKLFDYFYGRIDTSFGVGTNFTNDCNVPALQNVMKMVECNGNPVAKISNNLSKSMCEDPSFFTYLCQICEIK
jgi:nicotinate phosphoribosyltransferase